MILRYSRPEMARLWTDEARLARWLEVECAHLEALEDIGLAPRGGAARVRATTPLDVERVAEIERRVKHDVIAFLSVVEESAGASARLIHRGLTSSDVVDTALSMTLRDSADILIGGCETLCAALAERVEEHRQTVMMGRTHGMHAEPTTFGLVLAGHLAEIARGRDRLRAAREEIAVGKLSGAVGTYAESAPAIETVALAKLGLRPETVATQIVPRDRHAAFFQACALLATGIERLALTIRHLQRSEVGEVSEAFAEGQRGSSAMPHKRNPVLSENVTGLARLVRAYAMAAMEDVALWHERDISHSSAERAIAPDATITLDFMIARTTDIVCGLVVNTERMRTRVEETRRLVYSGRVLLALVDAGLARQAAHGLVQLHAMEAQDSGGDLREEILADEAITSLVPRDRIERCFDAEANFRHVDRIIDRCIAATMPSHTASGAMKPR